MSTRKYKTARALSEANECRPCNASGCTRNRHGMSTYCAAHATAKRLYGHPNGRRIRKSEYSTEARSVRNLMKSHPHHPGINAAVDHARCWLESGRQMLDGIPAPEQAARLYYASVTPERVIEELLSVSLWLHHQELHLRWLGSFEVDAKAVGTALLHLAPRNLRSPVSTTGDTNYQRHGGPVREQVGKHFLDPLRPLIVNVIRAIESEEQAKQDRLCSLRQSFTNTQPQTEGEQNHD